MRLCALVFQAYLAARIGPGQLGVFGIITSVGMVFATISISGIRFSVTRLVAEEISNCNEYPRRLMCCAFKYGSFFGLLSGAGMYLLSGVLSKCYIGDADAVMALRIMALSMPAIALGGCVEGYFSAKQKIFRLVVVQAISQLLRIAFVVLGFVMFLDKAVYPSDILAMGYFVGEGAFAAFLFLLYLPEIYRKKDAGKNEKYFNKLVKTAMPLAVSAYMRTGLSSLGQVIIPAGLKKSGMGSVGAFSIYGIITQMSMPVVMFPSALLSAMGNILIPRLTEAQVRKQNISISYIVNRSLRIGAMFSFGIMGVMLFFADGLAEAIYKNSEAAIYIRLFAPLIPVIYIDCVTDGCLKGLGQQVYSMMYNVFEGIINVVLLFFLLPRMAMTGYILVMYIKEIFNATLSIRRLSRVTSVDISTNVLISVCLCTFGARLFGKILMLPGVWLNIIVYLVFYSILLYVINAVTREDIKWIVTLA